MTKKSNSSRVVLVTGAASGIGEALAREYASQSCQVFLSDVNLAGAQAVADSLTAAGFRAQADRVDVTNLQEMQAWVDKVWASQRQIDLFVNNAGVAVLGLIENFTAADWARQLDVNIKGVTHGIQAVYPVMIDQGFGQIVNVASMAGLSPVPCLGVYSATKHFVVALSKSLRLEGERHGVKVSALCPGVIRTAMLTSDIPRRRPVEASRLGQWWKKFLPIELKDFVRQAVRGIEKNKPVILVPGFLAGLIWFNRAFSGFERSYQRADLKASLKLIPEFLDPHLPADTRAQVSGPASRREIEV